jgi:hypothetical protein
VFDFSESAALLTGTIPSYREFTGQVILPDGRQASQPLSVDGHPAQSAIIDAMDSGKYQRFAWAKPVQDGGTLIGMVAMLRRAILESQTVVLAYPTGDSAKDVWTTKVLPVLVAYGGQSPDDGGGSRGGAARVVTLPRGGKFILRSAGGRGQSGQASITGDALLVDEVDDWPDLETVERIGQRINESIDPLAIYCCTVKGDGEPGKSEQSKILAMVEEGTASSLEYPCSACGAFLAYTWERVDPETVCLTCDCGHQIEEPERIESLKRYRVVHKNPLRPFFTIRWSALDSPRKSLFALVTQWRRAQEYITNGDHGAMRSFFHDRLTRTYTGDKLDESENPAQVTRSWLARRSSLSHYGMRFDQRTDEGDSKHEAEVFPGPEFLVASVDVQRGGQRAPGRLYFELEGWCDDRRSYLIAWGHIVAAPSGREPTEGELHDALTRCDQYLTGLATDHGLPLLRRGVDVGDRQQEILRWIGRSRTWWATNGIKSSLKATEPGDIPDIIYHRRQESGAVLRFIPTAKVREAAQMALLLPLNQPGALHLPRGLSRESTVVQHYASTALIPDGRGGVMWAEKQEHRAFCPDYQSRHDFLDCRTYCHAMAETVISERRKAKLRAATVKMPTQGQSWVGNQTPGDSWI